MFARRYSNAALLAAVTLTLLACADDAGESIDAAATEEASATVEGATPEASGSEDVPSNPAIAVARTGWLTIGSDGAVQITHFDPQGRYRDLRNGEMVAQGNWQRGPENRLCFEPDAGRGECWTIGDVDEEGEAIATDSDGKTIAIRRVAYLPPQSDAASEESQNGDDAR